MRADLPSAWSRFQESTGESLCGGMGKAAARAKESESYPASSLFEKRPAPHEHWYFLEQADDGPQVMINPGQRPQIFGSWFDGNRTKPRIVRDESHSTPPLQPRQTPNRECNNQTGLALSVVVHGSSDGGNQDTLERARRI